jgi:alpha-glucoside transport system substrate-binding protein
MSDLAPSSFGGTKGAGEWQILIDFFNNPTDVAGTQQKLEAAAAAAWG